ncbi:virulence associated secretory protein [Salmonella enterica subsp. enterica]|uniref:Virulence associated secretory protein n=1 Tax=Salmonella enterica I TaxID=59201 RepID=A0A3S4JBI5_SALET|nr:virulence associated secretory protein [Salmonella enterica subsp. enterica]
MNISVFRKQNICWTNWKRNFLILLKEVLRHATVQRISEVLQRLLSERVSVRNMKLIMEALALWAPREKDVINLVEHIRGANGALYLP